MELMSSLLFTNMKVGYEQQEVLSEVSMSLAPGYVHAILGENGSGKSTLIKAILGHLPLQGGTLSYQGKNLEQLSTKERAKLFGYVPQAHGAGFNYPVLEMVVMGRNPYLSLLQRPSQDDYQLAKEALETLGIAHLGEKYFLELSGGQKQLVLLARALTQQSTFLLLDEPTSHLDFYHQHQVLKQLTHLATEQHKTMVVTMHDPNLTLQFADYVHMLKNGTVLASGRKEVVMTSTFLSKLYGLKVELEQLQNGRLLVYAEM